MDTTYAGGHVVEVKQEDVNGVSIGTVAGYIAAFSVDEGGFFGRPDRFHPGTFLKSIEEHKRRGNRPIRLRDHHGRTVGGFPIETVKEDSIGLFGIGQINLEVQQGREAHSLARQGVLSDFSVGFISRKDEINGDVRDIFEADIFEGSIVDEPMNRDAKITEVKSLIDEIMKRVTQHNNHADTESKLRLINPAETISIDSLEVMSVREIEQALSNSGAFSKKAATVLASRIKGENVNSNTMGDVLREIRKISV